MTASLPDARRSANTYTLQTLANGLSILQLFSNRNVTLTLPEICARSGLGKSQAYKLISTLHEMGFLRRLETPGYSLGPSIAELGLLALEQMTVPQLARQFLKQIAADTHETAILTMRRGDYSICVAKVDSPLSIRMAMEIGARSRLNAGGSNVPLLAFGPEHIKTRYLAGDVPLVRFTEHTAVTPQDIRALIDTVGQRGYHVSKGEVEPGVMAVGAPILDRHGQADFAISAAGPEDRMTKRESQIIEAVTIASKNLSAMLPA